MSQDNLLSRFISNYRIDIEINKKINIGFKLNEIDNSQLYFAKYYFNSNNNNATVSQWLTVDQYVGTQYIGFIKLENVINELCKNKQSTSYYSKYGISSDNFFTFNINHINANKYKLDIVKLQDRINPENNIFKYFEPPEYTINYEGGNTKIQQPMLGEVDIVASDMYVWGFMTTTPHDLCNINITDKNINVINNILDTMSHNNILHTIQKLKTKTEILTNIENNITDTINKNITTDIIKDTINSKKNIEEKIRFHDFYLDKIKQPNKKINIQYYYYKYYNENFVKTLDKILEYLNNPAYTESIINILNNLIDENKNEPIEQYNNERMEQNNKKQKTDYRNKYLKYKLKYLKLKKSIPTYFN